MKKAEEDSAREGVKVNEEADFVKNEEEEKSRYTICCILLIRKCMLFRSCVFFRCYISIETPQMIETKQPFSIMIS